MSFGQMNFGLCDAYLPVHGVHLLTVIFEYIFSCLYLHAHAPLISTHNRIKCILSAILFFSPLSQASLRFSPLKYLLVFVIASLNIWKLS